MRFDRIIKYVLAVTAAGLLLHAFNAHSAEKQAPAKTKAEAKAAAKPAERTIKLEVTEDGYVPSPVTLKKDEPVVLLITRRTDKTCATEVVMKEHNINQDLPLNKEVSVRFTPSKAGTLKYGCAMGQMISGNFLVE